MNVIWKIDPAYPPLLHAAHKPPKRLFYEGQPLSKKDRYCAIVGTRRPSYYGEFVAKEFSSALAAAGFVIVSGLAQGIDTIAHQSALDASGRTIAVLGSGFNHMTPRSNKNLAEKIKETGTILTEYEESIRPTEWTFPERNRIIAGMSFATLVIEAPERSGALITARFALEYGREIFAVPGNINQETSKGTNKLIKDGAAGAVTQPEDIFEALKLEFTPMSKNVGEAPTTFFSPEEKTIYKMLKKAPHTIDELILESSLSAATISQNLSLLELKGFVTMRGTQAFITR